MLNESKSSLMLLIRRLYYSLLLQYFYLWARRRRRYTLLLLATFLFIIYYVFYLTKPLFPHGDVIILLSSYKQTLANFTREIILHRMYIFQLTYNFSLIIINY